MPEITDQELEAAKKAIALLQTLQGNPESRAHFERSLKVVDPKYETAEDQAARLTKPYEEKLEAFEKRWAERDESEQKAKADAEAAEAEAKLNSGFDRLRKDGVTDEGMEKITALMKERTIPDPEAAYALWQRQNPPPPAEQSAYKPQAWDLEGDLMPNSEEWFMDPDGAEDRAIGQVLLEERRRSGGE